MDVIVGYATVHGSTTGVAERIAGQLRAAGARATVAALVDIGDVDRFDAAILGSAIHSGKWLPEAERFVDNWAMSLAERPTWLFSVCSVGDSNSFFPDRVGSFIGARRKDSKSLSRWRGLTRMEEHRYFSGAIEAGQWGRLGNLFLRVFGGTYGDHRDWADIDLWAGSIAKSLMELDEG